MSAELKTFGHSSFRHIRSHAIDTLSITLHEFEHIKTGAFHYHFESKHQENVFMLALRTVPMDSRGVAHILEHTALCGSEKFPVRDPFFLMIRRSLNTYMNAFTTSDYTAYPFASQNSKDFGNLLDIYLDAVFFSRLNELDFMQEGHRLEFETMDDPSSDLVYRGVVYNEMKGDSSSVISVLYDAIKKHLFPTSTYHHNSGGDPRHIPDLSYEDLKSFYKSHYHPTNAVFMTFGNRAIESLQLDFEEKALHAFGRSPDKIEVLPELRYSETKRVEEPYAAEAGEVDNKTHIIMAWLLGPSTDLSLLLKCNLLSDVLLDTAGSPLRRALEDTQLGGAVSPLCGLEESHREMSFFCGIEGSNLKSADDIEALILETLDEVSQKGVSLEKLEACLHQLELNQREIGGDGSPFGLQLMLSCMSAAIHRGDPIALLDLDTALDDLRQEITRPAFFKDLVQEILIDNQHRVRLCLYPDLDLNARMLEEERAKLSAKKQGMSGAQKQDLIKLSEALVERQNQEEPLEVLPKVGLSDISLEFKIAKGETSKVGKSPKLTRYSAGTNGIVYQQIMADLPSFSRNQYQKLPLFTQIVSEIGSGGRGFLETQHLQHSLTGGIGAYTAMRADIDNPDKVQAHITYSSRGLNRNSTALMSILKETFENPNFEEVQRVRDLVKQLTMRRLNSINGNGHVLAMSAASSYFRPVSKLNYHLGGLAGIQSLKKLNQQIDNSAELEALITIFKDIQHLNMQAQLELLLVSEKGFIDEASESLLAKWQGLGSSSTAKEISMPFDETPLNQAWITNAQVNFCASVFPTVAENHKDAASLTILAGVMSNGFLHKAIREQGGAYGGGAGYDASNGLFRFYSYRDPNLEATFEVFNAAVQWMLQGNIKKDLVEEAILGVISSIDAPGSPSGEARQAFHNSLFGRGEQVQKQKRKNILKVSVDDIQDVAEKYLQSTPSMAVVAGENAENEVPTSFQIFRV